MTETLQYRFRLRRRTAASWASLNEVLLDSEIGIESDTGLADGARKMKVGDGATQWNDLPYLAIGVGASGSVNRPAGSAYTFTLADIDATIISSSSDAFALTIPANADVAFAIGTRIAYVQGDAGAITLSGAAGVTVRAPNGNVTRAQWDGGVAEKIGADEWQLWNPSLVGTMASQDDAPIDGKTYGRKNGAWAEAANSGAGSSLVGINDQAGTAYTLVLTDAGKDVRCTNAAAITLTVPLNADVALPVGTLIAFSQGGAGVVTATPVAGVTINAKNGKATTGQYDARVLEYLGSDTWRVW